MFITVDNIEKAEFLLIYIYIYIRIIRYGTMEKR